MIPRLTLLVFALLPGVAACSASTPTTGSSTWPTCPSSLPSPGAPCTPPAPDTPWACEYGSDPHCTTVATCARDGADAQAPAWVQQQPDPSCSGNPAACPAQFDAGSGGACPVTGSCTYAEGRCACGPCWGAGLYCPETCGGQPGMQWECAPWDTHGCPEPRPLLGSPCSTEGQECGGIACSCTAASLDPGMECSGGFWVPLQGGC